MVWKMFKEKKEIYEKNNEENSLRIFYGKGVKWTIWKCIAEIVI